VLFETPAAQQAASSSLAIFESINFASKFSYFGDFSIHIYFWCYTHSILLSFHSLASSYKYSATGRFHSEINNLDILLISGLDV